MNIMKTNTILAVAGTFSIIGFLDALYLSYARYTSSDIACSLMDGCNVVAASEYAVMLGVPLAYAGVLFYIGMIVLLGLIWRRVHTKLVKDALLIFATFGALSSIYFIYVQAVLIGAFCMYCIISAIITFLLLGFAFLIDEKVKGEL
jgi:uncharacterized membrane protein